MSDDTVRVPGKGPIPFPFPSGGCQECAALQLTEEERQLIAHVQAILIVRNFSALARCLVGLINRLTTTGGNDT